MTRCRLCSVVCLLTVVIASCGGGRDAAPTGAAGGGGVAVYCAVNTADALNSFVSADEAAADLRPALYTPLVLYDSVGDFKPGLAKSWTWSDDHRVLKLALRNDVKWHDGKPVTASDVAWTLSAAADSAYPFWGRAAFADLDTSIVASDGIELRFTRPFTAGLEPFATLPIMPRHALDTIPPASFRTAPYHQQPIGNGPFKFAGRLPDGSVKLDRVADYPADLGRALLDRIVVREVPDPSTILVELRTGGVDVCTVGSSIASEAATAGNTILPVAPVGSLIIALDNKKTPFDDARVRRALSASLNRVEIAAAVSRAASPARTFLPEAAARWRNGSILQPDNDAALAAASFDSAGWLRGADSIRVRNGQRLRFTITAPAPFQNVLTVVQSQWRHAGADVQLRLMEPSAFFGLLGQPANRPAAAAVIYTPDRIAFPDAFPLFHSTGDFNITSYANPTVDAALDRLRSVIPDDERARLYHDVERNVAVDVPLIFTVQTPRMLAVRPRLHDVQVDANGPFANAAHWRISGDRP